MVGVSFVTFLRATSVVGRGLSTDNSIGSVMQSIETHDIFNTHEISHALKLLPLLLCCGLLTAHGQSYRSLIVKADSLYDAKDFKKSIQVYEQAFKLERRNHTDLYNAACSAALALEKEKAYDLLESAVENGWINVGHLKEDADLTSLHGEKRWETLLERADRRLAEVESHFNKPMQKELLQIFDDDQKYRMMIDTTQAMHGYDSQQMRDLWKTINDIDSSNLTKVRRILDTRGWVGPDTVGGMANQALFLVIQHADLKTQEQYLPMMKEAVATGKASATDLALLIDRVEMRNGRPQVYGSQINMKDGKYAIYRILDEANVNKRRAEVGLPPLEQYVKRWNIEYAPPPREGL
jgi:hypothetical protein